MTTNEILSQVSNAIDQLMRDKTCSIDIDLAEPFANAISAMGICICGGLLDTDNHLKWFYLDNKHNDYKI